MALIERSNIIESTPALTTEIFDKVVQGSKILPLMRRLPDMTKSKESIAVNTLMATAYWVSGDTGMKETTKAAWENKYLYAEEIAVVVPMSVNVLNDSDYDIIGNLRPQIIAAFDKKIDEAILSGKNKPARFREGLIPSILNAGNNVVPGDSDTLYKQISTAMGKVEEDGYEVNAILGGVGLKKVFREGLLDTAGQPLQGSEVTGLARAFIDNGSWSSEVKAIVGDFQQAVYSIREDIEFKLFDTGVVTDNAGNIIYNLMQQDMVALRATMRIGWEIPNPVNALNGNSDTRFPFAYIQNASAPTTYGVTFTVLNASSSAVSGAKIDMAGQTKTTDASGIAVFNSLGNATYNYAVKKANFVTFENSVSVASSSASVGVTLIKK